MAVTYAVAMAVSVVANDAAHLLDLVVRVILSLLEVIFLSQHASC